MFKSSPATLMVFGAESLVSSPPIVTTLYSQFVEHEHKKQTRTQKINRYFFILVMFPCQPRTEFNNHIQPHKTKTWDCTVRSSHLLRPWSCPIVRNEQHQSPRIMYIQQTTRSVMIHTRGHYCVALLLTIIVTDQVSTSQNKA